MSGLVSGYGSSSSEDGEKQDKRAWRKKTGSAMVNSAPEVLLDARHGQSESSYALSRPVGPDVTIMTHNLKAEAMHGEEVGPVNPYAKKRAMVEATFVDDTCFDERMYGETIGKKTKKRPRRKEEEELAPSSDGGLWADVNYDSDTDGQKLTKEQKEYQQNIEKQRQASKKRLEEQDQETGDVEQILKEKDRLLETTRTEFVGSEERDYQGRSWTKPPSALRETDWSNISSALPKKLLHTWTGHSKGIQGMELFPRLGHLILTGSLDGTCRISGVYESCGGGNGRGEKRRYIGHEDPIRDLSFSNDGAIFASGSYDRKILIWDVESGIPTMSLTSGGAVPQCVQFYPLDNNILVTGMSNKKILQWDLREGKVVQKYEHHLSAVNTVTFFDNGKRFISSSDDKKLLVWDWTLPVPTKYISDPSMQSMPVVRRHPSEPYIACQSMDNRILTFELSAKVRYNKRVFKGHNNAGFACALGFAPDGKFIISGDSGGRLFFWNWRNCQKVRELKVHDQPCTGAIWHPVEPSWVITSSYDGLVKLWE